MWVRRPQGINLLFVLPEGIQNKEGLWAGRTGQPNTQVGPAHMDANGHMTGGWFFTAPLNSTSIDPLDTPHIQMKGCDVDGDGNLHGLRDGQGEPSCAYVPPSAMRAEDSRSTSSCSWECGFDIMAVGVHQHLLTGGWAINVAEWDRVPYKTPYKPSTSDLATMNSTFWRPTATRH